MQTQLAILGAGPGGYAAAFLAADLGMNVTLIDLEKNPGGVCLHRGCIPSKALLHVAKLIREAEESAKWGIEFAKPQIDLDKLRNFKENVVEKLTSGTGQLVKQRKINYIQGKGKYLTSNKILVEKVDGTTEEVEFEKSILATGSVPAKIPAFNINPDLVIDSSGALQLSSIPEKMLVVGGGYIGLEMATVYSALGSKVTVVEMMPQLLPGADKDMVRILASNLEKHLESIYLSTKVVSVKESNKQVEVVFEGEKAPKDAVLFDKVLVSVGRKPITDGLGLENTKVTINSRGFVEINNQQATNDPNIFAIGDIVGGAMLAHKASAEGKVAVEVIAGHKSAFEPNAIPAVVFTDPELAWAGITENEAKEKGMNVKIMRFPWAASGRATTVDRNDGLTKLIFDAETERILGMGIVGVNAGEIISEGVLAIEMSALAIDIAMSIHPHPTLSETVMESAEMLFGQSTHLYRPIRK